MSTVISSMSPIVSLSWLVTYLFYALHISHCQPLMVGTYLFHALSLSGTYHQLLHPHGRADLVQFRAPVMPTVISSTSPIVCLSWLVPLSGPLSVCTYHQLVQEHMMIVYRRVCVRAFYYGNSLFLAVHVFGSKIQSSTDVFRHLLHISHRQPLAVGPSFRTSSGL